MNSKRWVAALATGILCTTGLTSLARAFQEAPMLTELVEAGSLPPVDERLPAKPTVVNALEVGQYGGTGAAPSAARAIAGAPPS
ncbi:hypothetical protein N8D56_02500 [Devosia sp. A8/3-2]|nr:hypothetical protein N8D56_02500 [Devosia sp. A8/3-2]